MIVIKQRIWFHFDDDVMDMWWKLRREEAETGSEIRWVNPLTVLFALCEPKLISSRISLSRFEWGAISRGNASLCNPLDQLTSDSRCAKSFQSLIRWISRSKKGSRRKGFLIAKAISSGPWDGSFYLISYEFHYQTKSPESIVHP